MADAAAIASPRALGVAALLLAASDALQARLGAVAVRGELSGFTRAASGHCYFTLKDADGAPAVLRCAMFRRAAALLDFEPRDGQQVEVRGRIGIYEPRGELQCVAEAMRPLGAGSLYELFLRLKAKLEAAGLFDASRKRIVARYPRALGVVSSTAGAALHDVLTTLARRAPHVPVVVYPSAVQGSDAPVQLVQAIAAANARAEVDTLIVCRGGGSIEDVWSFNDETVVRAIAGSALPVVCGVGHETDITLADLAADLRAPTPTAAAELAAPRRDDELQRLDDLSRAIALAAERHLHRQAQRLDVAVARLGAPAARVQQQQQRLAHLHERSLQALRQSARLQSQWLSAQGQRLRSGVHAAWQLRHDRLLRAQERLQALDPRRTLQRGFAWIHDAQGRVVTSAAALQPGQVIGAVWADGEATAQVSSVSRQPLAD
ncbi:MAG: exodeoxyribonuclease VII large subunit [Burkholderiaceae bacterium]